MNKNNNIHYSNGLIKSKISTMIQNKVRPAVAISKTGKMNDTIEFYKSSYKYVEWENPEFLKEHTNNIYSSLVECAWDYPERYVHLLGFVNEHESEYLSENLVIYEPPKWKEYY